MFVLKNFLLAATRVLDIVLSAYMWIVIIRAVLSWVSPDPYNPIVRAIAAVTDPFLSFLRRKLPLFAGSIDFSPMVAILVIVFLKYFLVQSLLDFALRLP